MLNLGKQVKDARARASARRGLFLADEAEKYRLAILAEVEKIQIDVPVLSWATLVSRARDHHRASLARCGEGAKEQGDSFPERTAVNYLCSLFEAQYQRVYYATLAVESASLLRVRVLHAIADAYPQLSTTAKLLTELPSGI
ncbi:MAG: hypothetical protein ACLPSH_18535 [Vulcanimicrobiaceae bacterium]